VLARWLGRERRRALHSAWEQWWSGSVVSARHRSALQAVQGRVRAALQQLWGANDSALKKQVWSRWLAYRNQRYGTAHCSLHTAHCTLHASQYCKHCNPRRRSSECVALCCVVLCCVVLCCVVLCCVVLCCAVVSAVMSCYVCVALFSRTFRRAVLHRVLAAHSQGVAAAFQRWRALTTAARTDQAQRTQHLHTQLALSAVQNEARNGLANVFRAMRLR
jgi:hypothetical protein